MCGIVGVIENEDTWLIGDVSHVVLPALERAVDAMPTSLSESDLVARLETTAEQLWSAEANVRGVRGVVGIASAPAVTLTTYQRLIDVVWERIDRIEAGL